MHELTSEEKEFIKSSLKKDVLAKNSEKTNSKGKKAGLFWEVLILSFAILTTLTTAFVVYIFAQIQTVGSSILILSGQDNNSIEILSDASGNELFAGLEQYLIVYEYAPLFIGVLASIAAILFIVYILIVNKRNMKKQEALLQEAKERLKGVNRNG